MAAKTIINQCAEASFVLTKDRAFFSKTSDSHDQIIIEHDLHADGVGGPNVARVKIVPPGGEIIDCRLISGCIR